MAPATGFASYPSILARSTSSGTELYVHPSPAVARPLALCPPVSTSCTPHRRLCHCRVAGNAFAFVVAESPVGELRRRPFAHALRPRAPCWRGTSSWQWPRLGGSSRRWAWMGAWTGRRREWRGVPLGGDGSGWEEASVCGERPATPEPCCALDPASPKPNEGQQAVETCAVKSRLLFLFFPSSPTLFIYLGHRRPLAQVERRLVRRRGTWRRERWTPGGSQSGGRRGVAAYCRRLPSLASAGRRLILCLPPPASVRQIQGERGRGEEEGRRRGIGLTSGSHIFVLFWLTSLPHVHPRRTKTTMNRPRGVDRLVCKF